MCGLLISARHSGMDVFILLLRLSVLDCCMCLLCVCVCESLSFRLLPLCIYITYTELSWSSLCELLNKGGQWIKKQTEMFLNQKITAWTFFRSQALFFFYLPCTPLCVSDRVDVLMKNRGRRCFRSELEICIQLLDQSHISLQTKLSFFFLSWRPLAQGTFKDTHFIAISIFAWSFFHYRNTFTGFIGLFFFTLFDMLPHQRNSNEKRKQTEISIFSFSPEGIEEYIRIIFSTEMTHPK